MPVKKKKKKLAVGGPVLYQNQLPQQQGLTQDLVSDTGSTAGAVGGGMAQGAAAGMAMGPIGMLAGAAIGGITGAINRGKQKKAIAAQNELINQQNTMAAFKNAGNKMSVAHGGKIKKPQVIQGGNLERISPDSVEVQANNPNLTDSVELKEAFVDDGEMIKDGNLVFSDQLYDSDGKTFAHKAKMLERMKSKNPRFKDSNERIDKLTEAIFARQEQSKAEQGIGPEESAKMAKGGKIYKIKRTEGGPLETGKEGGVKEEKIMFNSTAEAQQYYKNKAIAGLSPEDKQYYDDIVSGKVTNITADGFIALRNPTPLNLSNVVIKPKSEPMGNVLGRAYGLAEGGILRKKLNPDRKQPEKGAKPMEIKGPTPLGAEANAFLNRGKKKLLIGGFNIPDFSKLQEQQMALSGVGSNGTFAQTPTTQLGSGPTLPGSNSPSESNALGQKIFNGVATFAPNLVNAALQSRLRKPPEPRMENERTLKRVSARPQLASANRAYNQAKQTITANTAGAGNLTSGIGSLMAKRLEAENQIYGQVNNQNIGISNQEAGLNTAISARNVERNNLLGRDKVEFANKKLQMTSENVANLSGKIQAQGRERNMMNLDKQKYAILQQRYSELPQEMKAKYANVWDFYNSDDYKENQAFGGYLPKKLAKKKKS